VGLVSGTAEGPTNEVNACAGVCLGETYTYAQVCLASRSMWASVSLLNVHLVFGALRPRRVPLRGLWCWPAGPVGGANLDFLRLYSSSLDAFFESPSVLSFGGVLGVLGGLFWAFSLCLSLSLSWRFAWGRGCRVGLFPASLCLSCPLGCLGLGLGALASLALGGVVCGVWLSRLFRGLVGLVVGVGRAVVLDLLPFEPSVRLMERVARQMSVMPLPVNPDGAWFSFRPGARERLVRFAPSSAAGELEPAAWGYPLTWRHEALSGYWRVRDFPVEGVVDPMLLSSAGGFGSEARAVVRVTLEDPALTVCSLLGGGPRVSLEAGSPGLMASCVPVLQEAVRELRLSRDLEGQIFGAYFAGEVGSLGTAWATTFPWCGKLPWAAGELPVLVRAYVIRALRASVLEVFESGVGVPYAVSGVGGALAEMSLWASPGVATGLVHALGGLGFRCLVGKPLREPRVGGLRSGVVPSEGVL